MARRQVTVVSNGEEILRKKSKIVTNFDENLGLLIDDMWETLEDYKGLGLAAPQISVLKRVVVIDVDDQKFECVNPEIISRSKKEVIDEEGCLSVPNQYGKVSRPEEVKMKAYDRFGKEFFVEAKGLLARCICHELDHLDGILYIDKLVKVEEK